MAKRSKSHHAILGMLATGPKRGYDIKKEFERSAMFIWNESYGQIYPMLKKLVDKGFATMEVVARDDQPDIKIYTITEEGTRELERWLTLPAEPHTVRNEAMLKVYFGAHATPAMTRTHITRLRDGVAAQHEEIEKQRKRIDEEMGEENPNARFWKLSLRYGEIMNEALKTWCDEADALLNSIEDV